MGLIHARFQRDSTFFWDNRAASLEDQTLIPIQSPVEMGLNLDTLISRVSAKSFYPALFKDAFGNSDINANKISRALAQFIRSMNTFGSKFRRGVNTTNGNPSITPFINFTQEENLGKDLFMDIRRGNCQACHTRNVMVPQGAQNIGLDLVYADNGVGAVSGNPDSRQNGKFSVPSLINIELTAPYMHDGRYKTLEEVVNFYSDSIKSHPNLSGFLREILPNNPSPNNNPCETCPPRIIRYTDTEKKALVAFLKTLTDTIITNDARWSNPYCSSVISGTQEIRPLLSTRIFPNPAAASGNIFLEITNGQVHLINISIFSASGKLIYKDSFRGVPGKQTITLSDLSLRSGAYILQIESSRQQKISHRIVVE